MTGSVATDHLMTFPGVFADSIVPDKLDSLALSFLVDGLEIRRGGVAANISFGLAALGVRPVLVAAVGDDFGEYRDWLEGHGVDCASVLVSSSRHTARFICTTDRTHAQIASFYAGAMSEADEIELLPVVDRVGGVDLVVVGPNEPSAMLRHTDECRQRGYRFVADPSQQLAWSDGETVRRLVDGADLLVTNEYEAALTEQKSGWTAEEVLARVGTRVVTMSDKGARLERQGFETVVVPAVAGVDAVDPTGVGDAFRAGLVGGLVGGLDLELAARVGCVLASYVVETVGTQEYAFTREEFVDRFETTYGAGSSAQVTAWFDASTAADRPPR